MTRYTQTPNGGLNPHRRPDNRSRRAGIGPAWVLLLSGVLVALAVAVMVAASRPARGLDCAPEPCSGVGDPPIPQPMPPLGGCTADMIVMCPRAALPVVTR